MRSRPLPWLLACLLCLAVGWVLWHEGRAHQTRINGKISATAPVSQTVRSTPTAPKISTAALSANAAASAAAAAKKYAGRLSNTSKSLGQLMGDRHAILLENAFIDTSEPLNLSIPRHLQSQGDPGAYIVQARGPLDAAFRAMLAAAGATIVSYIPNDAYLVRISAAGAGGLEANPLTQAVIPYEPYYKIESPLLHQAAGQMDLPDGTPLNLGLFADNAQQTVQQIEKLGGQIIAQDSSPFGPVVRVIPPKNWTALATLPGVQIVEPYHPRIHANDLSRATLHVAADTQVPTNYMGLTGNNVMVEVNDSGIDAMHPDLQTAGSAPSRVFGAPANLVDTDGHGTHVAGIIAGDGTESTTVTNASGSIMPATNGQFRGMAPKADLFIVNLNDSETNLQEAAAETNALISNNSWDFDGDNTYDLEAASYDAAVRDARPEVPGSQPVLFVFSAGNDGNGDDTSDPGGGIADSILSPATAKNVITVGAIQEFRNITNIVTQISADGMTTNYTTPWKAETSTSYRVAGFSARGNVGIGTEGTYGRFKPDVVAPGTFIISTRSEQWDINSYFYINPINYDLHTYSGIVVQPNSVWANVFPTLPNNTIGVSIEDDANPDSPNPFPDLPIFAGLYTSPNVYDFSTTNDPLVVPGDPYAAAATPPFTIPQILATEGFWGFNYAVSNNTTEPISFDLTTDLITTNNPGDYFLVLSNLDQFLGMFNPSSTGPGPYYRYETGTSMSAAAISGVLALIQDYFTNTLNATPSPAMLKAMLINGARTTGFYNYQAQNSINFEGWGLANLTNSVPLGITTNLSNANGESMLILDQSPAGALATGDSHTYNVLVNPLAAALPLHITLAWTDPPGDPAAAIKLVNDLNLVVTNSSNPTNIIVYYGNDIPASSTYNQPENPTNPPVFDGINNVENVYLTQGTGTNFSVTVTGYRVNVNAVTAQTNNVVQDYALVISCGEGEVTNAFTVTDNGIVSNPTGDQDITFVTTTNTPLLNQFVGANAPLLNATNITFGPGSPYVTNALDTQGQTNQWHFYVVTNNALDSANLSIDVTNAAFITFNPNTLSIPRMGVFADSTANATRPEADIDLFVTTDPTLTNLNPVAISNCVNGTQIGASTAGGVFNGASLSGGGTEYVVDTNSTPGQVYYVGVKSEDQMASEYGFLSVFTSTPFSQMQPNGNQIVNGLNVPVNIPDGTPAHPGSAYVFGLALYPMLVGEVVVTDVIEHQNFGDLIGTLKHGNGTGSSSSVVLNNHDSIYNSSGFYTTIYDDSGLGGVAGSQLSDGPGNLNSFISEEGMGVWQLTEVDDSLTQTGSVQNFTMMIQPHHDLGKGIVVAVPAHGWFVDYVDVPVGYMELILSATNLTNPYGAMPVQMYERFGTQPATNAFDQEAGLTNCLPGTGAFGMGGDYPGNSIFTGPPLPAGLYFVGLYNPNDTTQNVYVVADLIPSPVIETYVTNGPPVAIPDDAVTSSSIFVNSTQQIASVNIGLIVTNARISDLAFTLISPSGQRILLMENRGGLIATNLGHIDIITNVLGTQVSGNYLASTNVIGPVGSSGQVIINYDFYTIPDTINIYYDGALLYSNTFSGSGQFTTPNYGPGFSTNITIVIDQGNSTNLTTQWTYTPTVVSDNFTYLTFTDDTNLTQTPIKFAPPPYDLGDDGTNYTICDFELATNGDYFGLTNIFDAFGGWTLPTNVVALTTILTNSQFVVVTNVIVLTNNEVSVVTDPSVASGGSNYLALGYGLMTRTISVTPGREYNLSFAYRGPGIAGWWRGEGNASDSSDPENYGNNGSLIGRADFTFPAGAVGQAFEMEPVGDPYEFAGTNTYVQIRQTPFLIQVSTNGPESTNLVTLQSSFLDVGAGGGLTIEGWINPTNVSFQQPLVEWLARVPTNGADTNLVIEAGPFLDRDTGHYYYLLGSTNWTTSETWATELGGHLVTLDTANEQNWVYDTFAQYGGLHRNLWIGLTNDALGHFGWSSGLTNVVYTNWAPGQPTLCSPADFYTVILGPTNAFAGLWVLENNNGTNNNGLMCGMSPSNQVYGVVEVNDIQTNGVQFWISVTNSPGTTNSLVSSNGCLYANLVDITNGWHEIYSAPGLVQSNIYQHVALTYDTNNGVARLYYNGTNVASTNLGVFVPKTTGDVLLGRDMSRLTNNFYSGEMDEMSIYRRALSDAEIASIYNISAFSTNRNIGKFDPSVTPPLSLAEAQVSLDSAGTNIIFGDNNNWQVQGFTFTPATNSLQLQVAGIEPGMLLDSFNISAASQGNLYYLPETSLDALAGDSAYGTWTLEIWDSRTGGSADAQLVSWQLQFTMQTNVPIVLNAQGPATNTVPPGSITYYAIAVPIWANNATNILVSASQPVDLLFNQTNPPTGSVPPDYEFLTNSTGGSYVMTTAAVPAPQLLPGQTYYLGVRNTNSVPATVVVEVDFDMTILTNGVPYTDVLNTNAGDVERYFAFDVTSNAYEATFQLLQLDGNADLVVRKGTPLPTLLSSDYGSFNTTNEDENIYVFTNSSPVPLSAGRWYLGVFRRDPGPIHYTILAKELDVTNSITNSYAVIDLTNGVPFNWTAGPGAALTNFFRFHATNTVNSMETNYLKGLRFELYNLDGNGDLTVQTNAPPLAPPFFQSSQNPGLSPETIVISTNSALTNLAADWYLGVPNNETRLINFTIVAVTETNGYFPAFPGATGSGGSAVGAGHAGMNSTVYHVTSTGDSGPGTLRDAVNATNRTVVFDISGIIYLQSPLVITNSNLTIAGQTAPGCGSITVAGQMTAVQSAHDVIIRDMRFRRGSIDDSLQLTNVSNVIADHVSAEWSSDNLISVLNSSNVTVQWSILADSLYLTNNPPPLGSLLRYGNGALSFNHNLYADNYSGSPRLGDNLSLDFVNNVIYDWGLFPGLSGGTNDFDVSTNGCTNQLNYVCNYLIAGADTANFATNFAITNIAFFGGTTNGMAANWIFQTNNFIDSDTNGILNGADTEWRMFTNDYTEFGQRFPLVPVTPDEAFLAYEKVLDFAGVDMCKRDWVDTNIVGKVRTQTGTLISTPPLAGMVSWWKAENNALDSVGPNNGTLVGGTSYTPGEVGQAFKFSNSGDQVSAPTTGFPIGTNDRTMECWVYINSFIPGAESFFAGYGNFGSQGQTYHFGAFTDHRFCFASWGNLLEGPVLNTDQWYHVAVTSVGTNLITLYLNGTNVVSGPMSLDTPGGTQFYIGSVVAPYNTRQIIGLVDELSVYKRALSQAEIQSIYNAGSAGKFSIASSVPLYLDTDQDGIPDFWEITFGTDPFTPSNNNDRDGDGYTDLEEYDNWLAGPHAVTVTNTPVGVDLQQLFGKTGNLSFSVTNGVHGFVYLTNVLNFTNVLGTVYAVTNTGTFSNSFAIFTPTNNLPFTTNYSGYASFDVYVTNNDTFAHFGPVTVSVVVSAVPVAINSNFPPVIITLTNAMPYTNSNSGGSDYYKFTVTNSILGSNPLASNAVGVLFQVLNPSANVTLVASYGLPLPSLSSYDYISTNPGTANENIVVLTNSTPVFFTNGDWYLAVVNISGGPVTYAAEATELLTVGPPEFLYPTNATLFTNIETTPFTVTCLATDTNMPVLPLTFALVSGDPTNMTIGSASGVINWTPTEAQGPSTNLISVSVANAAYSVTNTFTIIVEESNLPPVLPFIPNQVVIWPGTLVVTNTATDPDIPANPLTYSLLVAPTNAMIDTNSGIITWTPTIAQIGSNYLFTTVVTDTNPWAVNSKSLSATNNFYVTVLPGLVGGLPQTNTVPAGGINWYAVSVPTNALAATNILLFATNLPVNVWFSTNVPPTTTNSGDYDLMPDATNGVSVLTVNSAPTNIVPGNVYYLGVQNTNSLAVTYGLEVDFLLLTPTNTMTSAFFISSIVYTNIGGNFGFLLTWFAPSNDLFQVQWTAGIPPGTWSTFTNIVSYNTSVFTSPTNTQFNFFDDGSQTGGFGPMRYYRLILLQATNTLTLPNQSNDIATVGTTLTVTNTATDSNTHLTLSYSLTSSPAASTAASIDANGIITWNPGMADGGGEFKLTTIVTDNGLPPVSATNSFTVFVVPPFPAITNVSVTPTNVTLQWLAPSNDLFQVEWTTNLAPVVVWTPFPGVISSPNGLFTFTDTNAPVAMKFYLLLWLPLP